MPSNDAAALESVAHDLESRTVRALTEKMTTLDDGPDIYTVVSQSGSTYTVDLRESRCTCPDAKHNLDDDEQCKHERRVEFAIGLRTVPQWCERDAVDPHLGQHVDTVGDDDTTDDVKAADTPHAVTDGGKAVTSTESTDEAHDDADCLCETTDDDELGCFDHFTIAD